MAENKNQHYVPRFYQRHFSDDGLMTGVYIFKTKKYLSKGQIKHQASADYFYSKNLKIEKALGVLEGIADEVMDSLLANPKRRLTDKQGEALYVHTMMQLGRTLYQTKRQEKAITVLSQNLLKELKRIDEENQLGQYDDLPYDAIEHTNIKFKEPGAFVLGNYAQLIPVCRDLKCKVLINNTNVPFVTSDNPVCMYNQYLERLGLNNGGLAQRGLQLYMPVSPNVALMYYDPQVYKIGSMLKEYVEVKECDVCELNKMVASQANEILIVHDGMSATVNFEALGEVYDKYHAEDSVVGIVNETENTEDKISAIMGIISQRVDCGCKLSFVQLCWRYRFMTAETFDPRNDLLRKIADEIKRK